MRLVTKLGFVSLCFAWLGTTGSASSLDVCEASGLAGATLQECNQSASTACEGLCNLQCDLPWNGKHQCEEWPGGSAVGYCQCAKPS